MLSLKEKGFNLSTQNYIILLLCCATIIILPLIDSKIIPGHDYVFHVTRILDVAEALKEGIFPVRMYVDEVQFWGTPVGIFYPGLFAYIPALLKLAGVPIEICYNFFIAMIIYLGAISSWYGFSMLTRSKITGFYSAVLYISSGWYLIDAYIRNALGELLGLSFLPLAIACMIDFITKSKIPVKHYILGILSISAIIESHVLTGAFLAVCAVFLIVVRIKHISLIIIKRLFCLALVLFLLNATFIVPFLVYYIKVPVDLDFVEWFSKEGWSIKILFLLVVFENFWLLNALYSFFSAYLNKFYGTRLFNNCFLIKKVVSNYIIFFILGLFFIILSSELIPWDFLYPLKKFLEVMQFPWRFLGIATLFICVCGGFGFRMFVQRAKFKNISIMILISIVCITNIIVLNNLNPLPFQKIEQKIYWKRITCSTDDDYLYRGMNVKELFAMKNQYISEAVIYDWRKSLTTVSFSYSAKENSIITLPLVNYPGYVAVNQTGEDIPVQENNKHMVMIRLPEGEGAVKVYYDGLPLFKIADYISLISLVILLYSISLIQKQKMWGKLL